MLSGKESGRVASPQLKMRRLSHFTSPDCRAEINRFAPGDKKSQKKRRIYNPPLDTKLKVKYYTANSNALQ